MTALNHHSPGTILHFLLLCLAFLRWPVSSVFTSEMGPCHKVSPLPVRNLVSQEENTVLPPLAFLASPSLARGGSDPVVDLLRGLMCLSMPIPKIEGPASALPLRIPLGLSPGLHHWCGISRPPISTSRSSGVSKRLKETLMRRLAFSLVPYLSAKRKVKRTQEKQTFENLISYLKQEPDGVVTRESVAKTLEELYYYTRGNRNGFITLPTMPGVPSAEAPKLMPDGMTISSRMLNRATDIAVKKYGSLEEVDNETVSSVITLRSAFGDGDQLRDDISSRRSVFAKPISVGRSVSHNVPSRRVWSEQVRIPTPQGNDHMNDRRVFTNAEPNKATYSGGFEDA